jgi:hypothetical protein
MQNDSLAFMFQIILCTVEVESSEEWVNHLKTSFMVGYRTTIRILQSSFIGTEVNPIKLANLKQQ